MRGNYKAKHGVRGGRKTYVCSSKPSTPQFVTVQELEAIYKPDLYKNKQEIKRRYNGMKREILTFIEDLKDVRKECVNCCEAICRDSGLSHEGKVMQLEHNINELKKWASDSSKSLFDKINKKISEIDKEEAATLHSKHCSGDYNIRLKNMLEILEKNADKLSDEDIKTSLEQFADDPIAIVAFKGIFGFERMKVIPTDTRGKRQETLKKVSADCRQSGSGAHAPEPFFCQ